MDSKTSKEKSLEKKHLENNYKDKIIQIKNLKNRHISNIDEAINLEEIKRMAFNNLDVNALSYYSSGANNEITLRRNEEYFKKILLLPKILKNVNKISTETNILNNTISMPILIAPAALQKLANNEGEIATAKVSYEKNIILTLSSYSSTDLDKVAIANEGGIRWLQLYIMKNRKIIIDIIKRAESYGYSALVITVDAPVIGSKEMMKLAKMKLPPEINYEIFKNIKENILYSFDDTSDNSIDWEIIPWLRNITKLKIILKGISRPDDALKAEKYGADAIIVSNHGGRQLDCMPSGIEILYHICKALKNAKNSKMEVYMDGGIRRGTDVIKALAMGAKAVLIGRPIIWGLASDGQKGIRKVLDLIKSEFEMAMKLCGCISVKDITEDLIRTKASLNCGGNF